MQRYHKILDPSSDCYYYYQDSLSGETSWQKPLLAWPLAIKVPNADLRDNEGMRASGFSDGPLLERCQGQEERAMGGSQARGGRERSCNSP